MDERDLVYSRHCQKVTKDGKTIEVQIYGFGDRDWTLEVVDSNNTSTVWDDLFDTDDDAFNEFERTLKDEGIDSMISTGG